MLKSTKLTRNLAKLMLVAVFLVGCKEVSKKTSIKEKVITRKYDVRLSNSIGSDWYECDSIIDVSEKIIKLKNKEDKVPFLEIRIPDNVVVRISPK